MLLSMTGYGKAECNLSQWDGSIEIKSLNSKQLDIAIKIPVMLRDRELEIRSLIGRELRRGKIDFSIFLDARPGTGRHTVNRELAREYIRQLEELAGDVGLAKSDRLLQIAMRFPDAIRPDSGVLSEEDWKILQDSITKALLEVNEFRKQEGSVLEEDITDRIHHILSRIPGITPYEKTRKDNIRNRIRASLDELGQDPAVDPARFEQELIFYLEKYDITEEKVRLKNHCGYFLECMKEGAPPGKKLNFISQEMVREINTLGSKAYDSGIQRLVVEMKDELEKIREQLLNIL